MRQSDQYAVLGDLPVITMPPRSLLYHLEPIGTGTGRRESLVSYLDRLAWAHRIPRHSLQELPRATELHRADVKCVRTDWTPCFNAGGEVSQRWISLLQQLTRCPSLEGLTLYPISGLVNPKNLVARHRRWCPECLVESQSVNRPYSQLLWHIDCVAACPVHELKLERSCHCANVPTRVAPTTRVPGECEKCSRGLSETLPRRKANAQEVRVAGIVRDLLSDSKWDKGGWSRTDNRCRRFLQAAADMHFEGKPARLATALGVSKSSLHNWMNGKHRPSLPWFVDLADRFDCSVVDILAGRADGVQKPGPSRVRVRQKRRLRVSAGQDAHVQSELTNLLSARVIEPLAAVAKRLEVNTDYLRRRFPDESALIVTRWRSERTAKKIEKNEQFLAKFRARAEELVKAGVSPTHRAACEGRLPSRYSRLRPQMNTILLEVRKQMEPNLSKGRGPCSQ